MTRPYRCFRVAVLSAITTALRTKRPTRPSKGTCSKMGYGYLKGQNPAKFELYRYVTHHPLSLKNRSIQTQYPTAKVPDKPRAGTMSIVHGGEKKSRSINKTMDGMAWKLTSASSVSGNV